MLFLIQDSQDSSIALINVTTAILDELTASCPECGITNNTIDRKNFTCSSSYVTYRARLEGTSQADSLYLISLIEDWVESGGANIIVTGVIQTVDSQCPVAISSLSEGECTPTIPPPQPPLTVATIPQPKTPDNTLFTNLTVIIAVVIGLTIIIVLMIVVIAITLRKFYRCRHSR